MLKEHRPRTLTMAHALDEPRGTSVSTTGDHFVHTRFPKVLPRGCACCERKPHTRQSDLHLTGPESDLGAVSRAVLGASLEEIKSALKRP